LPPEEYWDADKLTELWERRRYQLERQETFWLSLLQSLDSGQEQEALRMLKRNRFRPRSWNPDLEDTLAWILAYRQGTIPDWVMQRMDQQHARQSRDHPLYAGVAQWAARSRQTGQPCAPPRELERLLRSKEVFAAAFLAGGWAEAALGLHRLDALPEEFPGWVAYGLTQAMRFSRGNQAALDFAVRQVQRPSVELLIGELRLATGDAEQGLSQLEALAAKDSDVGFRSAWLAALAHIEARRFARAERIVRTSPRLADSITGKEILARIALLQGETQEAAERYRQLGEQSAEAMTYMARDAFAKHNWNEARRLTVELLKRFPDELQLRANLDAIANAENSE